MKPVRKQTQILTTKQMNKALIFIVSAMLFVLFSCNRPQLPHVRLETSLGNIVIEVDTLHAPITAKNFISLVGNGVYSNALFYRVVKKENQPHNPVKIEVVQGGLFHDSLVDLQKSIVHETTRQTGILHKNGTVSMARNQPGSASSEFFICIGNQPELDFEGKRNPDGQGFAAFGKVIEGMDVVKKIQQRNDTSQILIEYVEILSAKVE